MFLLIILSVSFFFLGSLLGIATYKVRQKKKAYGNIIFDMSDLQKDVINYEFSRNPYDMVNDKIVFFKVVIKS